MENTPGLGALIQCLSTLSNEPTPAEELSRWKQIKLIAENYVSDYPSYEGTIVAPLSACIYYSHFIAIVPDHKDAWTNIAIIADFEVGRLESA